jgi:hypothetical protein
MENSSPLSRRIYNHDLSQPLVLCTWTSFRTEKKFAELIRMSSHSIPRCWTLRNQFRQRNQFYPIPGIPSRWNLTDFQEFLSIPEFSPNGIARHSSVERNWNWFPESDGIPNMIMNDSILEWPLIYAILIYPWRSLNNIEQFELSFYKSDILRTIMCSW